MIFDLEPRFDLSPGWTAFASLFRKPGMSFRQMKNVDSLLRRESGSRSGIKSSGLSRAGAAGSGKTFISVAQLIDTNVLVYRVDARFPDKQQTATNLFEELVSSAECRIPHQALVEFYAAATRPLPGVRTSLLTPGEAREEIEMLLLISIILYPVENVPRLGLYGAAAFGLSWFDAHLWAYAEHYGCSIIYSEDFQHDRYYGSVKAVDPFA
jgi:predicted nucleic acid-binding protein